MLSGILHALPSLVWHSRLPVAQPEARRRTDAGIWIATGSENEHRRLAQSVIESLHRAADELTLTARGLQTVTDGTLLRQLEQF
jgi:hypothetical protein